MSFQERALTFGCGDARLVAVISSPQRPSRRGVLVIVGGPQYRAGSHRQFTVLCRALAGQGIPAMRFDYRGMGDAEGDMQTFEDVRPDIRAAIDRFCIELPEMSEIVLWGLCDAASAALLYADSDPRVRGMVLVNPWVRTEAGLAQTRLRHYYLARIADREFWRRVAHGEFAIAAAARSFAQTLSAAFGPGNRVRAVQGGVAAASNTPGAVGATLPERMARGLSRFKGEALLVLSGKDLTAQEFRGVVRASGQWRKLLSGNRVRRNELAAADHTFSRREWRDQVIGWTASWIKSW